jgi:hypothetical protein
MSETPDCNEAAYIAENFGIPFATALAITQQRAKKKAKISVKAAGKAKR